MWAELIRLITSKFLFLALHTERNQGFPRPLSKEEERHCFELAAAGDKQARDKLIEHNLRLVAHIAKKYTTASAEQDDLQSIGTIGLIKAVETYSPDRSSRFSSYAATCVENEIRMFFRSIKKLSSDVSINDPLETDRDGNPLTLFDLLADDFDLEESVDRKIDGEKLRRIVERELDPREKQIIMLRYGFSGCRPLTQREIARKMDISRSYVSRIEKKALEKLRAAFENRE